MNPKAILFDMDGVIVDTEPLHKKAYYKMFDELNISVSKEMYAGFTGNSTKKVCEKLISNFSLNKNWEELAEIKRSYFKHYFDTDPDFDLIPGVHALIEHYHENGLPLILASSAHMNTINWVLDKFNIGNYFAGKISGADLKESKPHPEIFLLAAQMAHQLPADCLVIEDSTNGIRAACAAHIPVVAYRSPHTPPQDYAGALRIIDDYQEIYLPKMAAW